MKEDTVTSAAVRMAFFPPWYFFLKAHVKHNFQRAYLPCVTFVSTSSKRGYGWGKGTRFTYLGLANHLLWRESSNKD